MKELGKELKTLWSSFEQKLAEADAFVAKQTPLKAQGLQESIKVRSVEILGKVAQNLAPSSRVKRSCVLLLIR